MQLDNELSPAFQRELISKDKYFQISPPVMHCRNAIEHAIIKFKYHFIVGLSTSDHDFLVQNWEILLDQA